MNGNEPAAAERLADELDGQDSGTPGAPLDAELADLVLLARQIAALRPAQLGGDNRAAMRLRLTRLAARHVMATRPLPALAPRRWPFKSLPIAAALACFLLLLALATAALRASAASLPGQPLYGVKLAREHAAITLAPTDAARANAYADQAADRLAEANRLADRADPAQLSSLTGEAQRALDRARQSAGGGEAATDAPLQRRLGSLETERQALASSRGSAAAQQGTTGAMTSTPASGPTATSTAAPFIAGVAAPPTATMQPIAVEPPTRTPTSRAAFAVLSPTPPPAPSPSSTVPIPSPGREARAVPSPPSQSVPTVESVRAPTARDAVQGFYTALNDALTRDPANFARAYGYLSDAARAQTPYAAFMARYQPDTGGIAARASRREIGTDATWTVVVDVVEHRGATRSAELVTWTLVPTSKGWRLDHASVQAAPAPTATLMPGRRQDQHDQRQQDQRLDQQGAHNGRASPACTPSATGGTSPNPTTCPGAPPARRGGSGNEPGGQKSD